MRRFLAAAIGLIVGYVALALLAYGAIAVSSNNAFDRSLEASMTAAFVVGPAGGVIGLALGLVLGRQKSKAV